MRIFILVIIVLAAVIFIIKAVSDSYLSSRCTKTAPGKLVSTDSALEGEQNGIHAVYFPIYEYVVDGMAYWARFEKKSLSPNGFDLSATISYDPQKPEICFMGVFKGTKVSGYNKAEYDGGGSEDGIRSDYIWRS